MLVKDGSPQDFFSRISDNFQIHVILSERDLSPENLRLRLDSTYHHSNHTPKLKASSPWFDAPITGNLKLLENSRTRSSARPGDVQVRGFRRRRVRHLLLFHR